ncbi:MAG: hypothetical protein OXR82_17490 [Gammaproteobacteria bacterium]|nr:hypothetical protein [Gammaproteobacteria bacterium]
MSKTHFVRAGRMNTLCGFGFRPWYDWFPATGTEAKAVTCQKCNRAARQLPFDVSGVVQTGRPVDWNHNGMRVLVEGGNEEP